MTEFIHDPFASSNLAKREDVLVADGKGCELIADKLFAEHARSDGRADVPLANSEVEGVVAKALAIAQNLNQAELRVAHLLLAMTLTEDGRRRLGAINNINVDLVRDLCWKKIEHSFSYRNP